MPRPTFNDLDNDVKAAVVERVLRRKDLMNLCLVNKELHKLSVRLLYRSISLGIAQVLDRQVLACLNANNAGLKHIRNIRLYLRNESKDATGRPDLRARAALIAGMFIELLPPDILEEFSCFWSPGSADLLERLLERQKNLRVLNGGYMDRDVVSNLRQSAERGDLPLQSVRKLHLSVFNMSSLELCQFLVQKTSANLHELTVAVDRRKTDTWDSVVIEPRLLPDSATAPGLLASAIFSHMLPFGNAEPLNRLRVLQLENISLRHCANTWLRIVNFNEIERLHIVDCPGADALLGHLSAAKHLPKRLKTLVLTHTDNTEKDLVRTVDEFLSVVNGLKELRLDLGGVDTLPAVAGIVKHGRSLELLSVHAFPAVLVSDHFGVQPNGIRSIVWGSADFGTICEACTKLKQLSCAWPLTCIAQVATVEWSAFERHVSGLRDLVTLQVTSFPENVSSSEAMLPLPNDILTTTYGQSGAPYAMASKMYKQLLRGLAERIFETFAHARKSVPFG